MRLITWLTALYVAAAPWVAQASTFPERDKTLKIVVPVAPSGGVGGAPCPAGPEASRRLRS